MDIFIEEIVKKENRLSDKLLMFGVDAVCVVAVVLLYTVVLPIFIQFAPIIFLLIAAIVYITYLFSVGFNLEYEYALVNFELDVDKISGKKRRKKLTMVNLQDIEAFGRRDAFEFEKNLKDSGVKKVFACKNTADSDVYFLIYTEKTVKKMLVFSPSEKMASVIEKLNPQGVVR